MDLLKLNDKQQVRVADEGDTREIYNLVQKAFANYNQRGQNPVAKETEVDILLDIKTNIVLVLGNEKIIGSLRLKEKEPGVYYLSRFAILPGYQQRGLGTRFFKEAEKLVKRKNGREIYLYSSLENMKLINFYEKQGFICKKVDYNNGYQRGLWQKII